MASVDGEFADDARTFEEYRPALRLLAQTQLGTRFRRVLDASDIVQQALLEAHRNADQIRAQSSVERFAWLRKILTNTVIDSVRRYRSGKRDVEREVSWEGDIRGSALRAEQWLADRNSSPAQRAERKELLQTLAAALLELPDGQREAVELYYLHGCTLEDVAAQMKRSGPSVAGLVHRGLQRLRELMKSGQDLSGVPIFAGFDS